jgi:hypothetical protein|tara:strand:- start:1015 stop:1209 length:195 start_codon:yes stop_codon:yes gene_type:complete
MKSDRTLDNIRRVVREMMAVGTGGLTASAPEEGPVAGYDKALNSKPVKRKLKKVKDLEKRWLNQ